MCSSGARSLPWYVVQLIDCPASILPGLCALSLGRTVALETVGGCALHRACEPSSYLPCATLALPAQEAVGRELCLQHPMNSPTPFKGSKEGQDSPNAHRVSNILPHSLPALTARPLGSVRLCVHRVLSTTY